MKDDQIGKTPMTGRDSNAVPRSRIVVKRKGVDRYETGSTIVNRDK